MRRAPFSRGRVRLRSPAAERVFSARPDPEAASADPDAGAPCTPEPPDRAGVAFAVETSQGGEPPRRSGRHVRPARVVRFAIPDRGGSVDPALVELLRARAGRHLA